MPRVKLSNDSETCLPEIFIGDLDGNDFFAYSPITGKMAVIDKEAKGILCRLLESPSMQENLDLPLSSNHDKADFDRACQIFSESGFVGKKGETPTELPSVPGELDVWLTITSRCNLACTYCYVRKQNVDMALKTGLDSVQRVFQAASKNGFSRIKIKYSGGEALLRLETVLEIKRRADQLSKESGIQVKNVLMTNGVLLSPSVCKTLKAEGFHVAVSLDGMGSYHDATRIFPDKRGSFEFVIAGLRNLTLAEIPHNISITLSPTNIENISQAVKWCVENGIAFAINFVRENQYSQKYHDDAFNSRIISEMSHVFDYLENNAPQKPIWQSILDRVNPVKGHNQCCGAGRSYVVIGCNGDLFNCQTDLAEPVGSINDSRDLLEQIDSGWKKQGFTGTRSGCSNCQWEHICCGGCPLLSKQVTGGFSGPSPYCSVYRALIPRMLRLEAIRINNEFQRCVS